MRQSGRAHYVQPNHASRVPRSFVYLDTEAHRTKAGRREVQTFRLAVAAYDTIDRHTGKPRPRVSCEAFDTAALWDWITARCRAKARTVLVAHNLAYDLRIADAFRELPARGWTFKAGRVDDGRAWMIWRNGNRTLSCVDSLSWVPKGLEELGELVGITKLSLPEEDDDDATWLARCTRDVEILAEVWDRLVRWVEDDDLGNWKLSGAGQSWAAFRHRFMVHRLLVHEDDDARNAERSAAATGRCEAWQHGKLTHGPYTEWDFTTAYARIGAECDVPVALQGEIRNATLDRVLELARTRAVLCEVEVTTDVPTVAFRDRDGIRWPVGVFRTTLWDNELVTCIRAGGDARVVRAWVYRRAPALRLFCQWVLDGLDGTRGDIDPIVRVALKHWSRALIGRTAARWSRWEPWGEAPTTTACVGNACDVDAGERYKVMQLGSALFRESERAENPDSMAAVMSWVMAESRVRLWNAMSIAGFGNVVYVDTDSLIVGGAGSIALRDAAVPGLRIKGEWQTIEVLGPRQLIPGSTLRAAGVPKGAVRVDEHTWTAEVWSGLLRSLRTGQADSVEVAERTFHLKGTDNRRRHLEGHETAPFRIEDEGAEVPVSAAS